MRNAQSDSSHSEPGPSSCSQINTHARATTRNYMWLSFKYIFPLELHAHITKAPRVPLFGFSDLNKNIYWISFDNSYYYAGILEVPCGVKVQVLETDVKAIRKQKLAETLLVLKNHSQRLHCLCKNILKRFFRCLSSKHFICTYTEDRLSTS
jgi:hypothetical protein